MPTFTLHCINKDCSCESDEDFNDIEEARKTAKRLYCPTCGLDVEVLESSTNIDITRLLCV